jgi:hypothetical protein
VVDIPAQMVAQISARLEIANWNALFVAIAAAADGKNSGGAVGFLFSGIDGKQHRLQVARKMCQ